MFWDVRARDALAHDGYWLEERAGYAFGYAYEVALVGEDFDEGCLRELGEVGLCAVAEAAERMRVGGDGGHLRQQGAGMEAELL